MFPRFRQSMLWLHRWIGIALGGLLFATFFAGTLAVFDDEIDRWMEPPTRLAAPAGTISLDRLRPALARQIGDAPQWGVLLPDARKPMLQLRTIPAKGRGKPAIVALDPASGRVLAKTATWGASGFFLPFHYSLLIGWMQLGYWIVGFAAAAMLLGFISGIAIHVRLIRNLFVFRPRASPRRHVLDLHNLAGVSALPFLFLMVASGLLVSYSNLMPAGINAVYGGNRKAFFDDVFENYRRPARHRPAPAAPIDPMLAEASRRWGGGAPYLVQVYNAGDAAAYVEIRRRGDDRITADPDLIYFDGVTGAELKYVPLHPAIATQRWLTGLHTVQFDRWALRWLYFLLGLMGCAMIATGLIAWTERRAAVRPGERDVAANAFVITGVAGPMIGALAYLVANRVLPSAMPGRALWEGAGFFAAWALTAVHAVVRIRWSGTREAWRDDILAVAALALAAPVLNAVTTGQGLVRSIAAHAWAVAGVDLTLLAIAVGTAVIGLRLTSPRKVTMP